jgi:glyoxylase-like metal-dependent hydrolase (beta-lactamase superfamily II)
VPLLIDGASLWLAETNCYVVAAERGGPCIIVDAPPDIPAIEALVAKHDLIPTALLVTHGHIDHAGGGAVAASFGIDASLHPDDAFLALDPAAQLRMLFGAADPELAAQFAFPAEYLPLRDGESLSIGGVAIDVVHTPGHTPGHCCFSLPEFGVLFSGDQLFAGSIGRTDLPGGSYDQLMQSMRTKVLTFPDDTQVLPGHGPGTTIATERRSNPFLQDLRG